MLKKIHSIFESDVQHRDDEPEEIPKNLCIADLKVRSEL
jgi:hypothetical protein